MLKSHVKENTRHCLTQAWKLLKEGNKDILEVFGPDFSNQYLQVEILMDSLVLAGRKEWAGKATEIARDEDSVREQGNI